MDQTREDERQFIVTDPTPEEVKRFEKVKPRMRTMHSGGSSLENRMISNNTMSVMSRSNLGNDAFGTDSTFDMSSLSSKLP